MSFIMLADVARFKMLVMSYKAVHGMGTGYFREPALLGYIYLFH